MAHCSRSIANVWSSGILQRAMSIDIFNRIRMMQLCCWSLWCRSFFSSFLEYLCCSRTDFGLFRLLHFVIVASSIRLLPSVLPWTPRLFKFRDFSYFRVPIGEPRSTTFLSALFWPPPVWSRDVSVTATPPSQPVGLSIACSRKRGNCYRSALVIEPVLVEGRLRVLVRDRSCGAFVFGWRRRSTRGRGRRFRCLLSNKDCDF